MLEGMRFLTVRRYVAVTVVAVVTLASAACGSGDEYTPPPGGNGGYQATREGGGPTTASTDPSSADTSEPTPAEDPDSPTATVAATGTGSTDDVHSQGTPENAALEWVEAYHSASYRDEGPTDWMRRVQKLSTDSFAETYETRIARIEAAPQRSESQWQDIQDQERDWRVRDAQATCIEEGRTDESCLVEITYTLLTSRKGQSRDDRIEKARALVVRLQQGRWLVDREQPLAD